MTVPCSASENQTVLLLRKKNQLERTLSCHLLEGSFQYSMYLVWDAFGGLLIS